MKHKLLFGGVILVLALAASLAAYAATHQRTPGDPNANPKAAMNGASPATGSVVKTFTGGGTTIVLTSAGNIASFTSPAGYQHMFSDGYEVCHTNPVGGAFLSAYDYDGSSVGWNAPTTTSTSPFTIRRTSTDNQVQLTQIYKFVPAERAIQVTMQVKNITGGTMTTLIVRRLADIDVDSYGANGYAGVDQNVWLSDTRSAVHAIVPEQIATTAGREAHSMVLRSLSATGTTQSFVDTLTNSGVGSCNQTPVDLSAPFTGDGVGGAYYQYFNVAAGATKTAKVEYIRP